MPIQYFETEKSFRLDTKTSSYYIQIDPRGYLLHPYYGKRLKEAGLSHILKQSNRDSLCPWPAGSSGYGFSCDIARMEMPCYGTGDFRPSALKIREQGGYASTDLRYKSHVIYKGKKGIEGLPATYGTEDEITSLEITATDDHSGAEVTLVYSVFEQYGAMTRSVRVKNAGDQTLRLERIFSASVDYPRTDLHVISNYGAWAKECTIQRTPVHHGNQSFGSRRGASGPTHNPFVFLTDPDANEEAGQAWGFCFLYSGNHLTEIELCSQNITRLLMGIHPEEFCYVLEPGDTFCAPEVLMTYSASGIGEASRTFHSVMREHLVRGKWKHEKRPLLINSWEGVYFKFDADRLVELAGMAAELGVELFVMDDGWFGKRYNDKAGLGDWVVNEEKLGSTLGEMVERIKAKGMKFGIWFEPEMVNGDSDLFRAHPDWAVQIPGRGMSVARHQFVLDMTREDVRDYIYEAMCKVLDSADISYIKWDYNRAITEASSALLPPERQGEFFHRFILGLYSLYERLIQRYPHILFEGCSSGGARFDAGILYYAPQSWGSDDTDAIERVDIQYGLSFCYPASSVGAHVSECPNHTTGRTTPVSTRGLLAMSGTGGYELDLKRMTEADKETVRGQVADYHKYYDLTHYGDYYRLISPYLNRNVAAWMFVSPDKREALVNYVVMRTEIQVDRYFRLAGLDPERRYRIEGTDEVYFGETLMSAGLEIIGRVMDGESRQYHLVEA